MNKYNFQYCQKIVIYSKDESSVLLCRRKNENDLDGIFTFAGGKLETTDENVIDGLIREKNEELGNDFKIKIFFTFTTNVSFTKKDGTAMILPHFYAIHDSGEIKLNKEEYSEFRWIPIKDIHNFEPKFFTIPEILNKFTILKKILNETDAVII